jgi:hypothetical protein
MSNIVTKGKYAGYCFDELIEKYKKTEDEWIKTEERFQKGLEEISEALKTLRIKTTPKTTK